jgi:hypothetical protein
VVGACIIEPEAWKKLFLKPHQCYFSGCAFILEMILEMGHKGKQIDLLTLTHYCYNDRKTEHINNINADFFITNLTRFVVSDSHLSRHQHMVIHMYNKRQQLIDRLEPKPSYGLPMSTLKKLLHKATPKYLRHRMHLYGKKTIEGNSGIILNVPNEYCVFVMHLANPKHTITCEFPGKITFSIQECIEHFNNKPRIS